MSELKPCPFCGGEAHAFHVGDWWVEHACKKLGKYIGTRFCETEEEAAAWWNMRAERTCHIVGFDDGVDEGIDGEWHQYAEPQYDLSCGHSSQGAEAPNYCPKCGRKVEA